MRYEMIPRTSMELLDGGFQLYRNHFAAVITVALWLQGPAAVIEASVFRVMLGSWGMPKATDWQRAPGAVGAAFLIYMLTAVLSYGVVQAALTYAFGELYHGRSVTPRDCIRAAAPRMAAAVGMSIFENICIVAGSCLLLVPGVIATLMWSVSMPALVLEKRGAFAALGRSRELTRGYRIRLGTLVTLLTVLVALITLGLNSAFSHALEQMPMVVALLQTLPSIALAPLYPAVMTLAYYDLRIRKEAYDLELASQDAAATPAL